MSADVAAANIAEQYVKVLRFAVAKAKRKWRLFLVSVPQSKRPFTFYDLDQWALEGLLILHGDLPGSNHGKLSEYEALPVSQAERFIQRSVDMHIGSQAGHAVEKFRADIRGNGCKEEEFDKPLGYKNGEDVHGTFGTFLMELRSGEPAAVTIDVEALYPLLTATKLGRMQPYAVAREHSMSMSEFRAAVEVELKDFTAWAHRNRRVAA